jgi:hypothetical protein
VAYFIDKRVIELSEGLRDFDMRWFDDVYLVNAAKLSEELRNRNVSEYQALKHLIVTTVLVGVNVTVPVTLNWDAEFSFSAYIAEYVIYFAILGFVSYYGLIMCFQTNSKGDGLDFFTRILALGLPVMVRMAIYSLIAFIPFTALTVLVLGAAGSSGMSAYINVQSIFYVAVNMCYFIMLRKYIAIAAGYR